MKPGTDNTWRSDDLEEAASCPVCSYRDLEPAYAGLVDMEEGVPGEWSMVRCGRCSSLILSPRPTRRALHKVYRSYYTHLSPDGENAILDASGMAARAVNAYLHARYGLGRADSSLLVVGVVCLWPLRQQLDYFMRHLPRTAGRLLDIGCGNGGFLQRARRAGWHVIGVEPDPIAASVAQRSADAEVHPNLDALETERFDLITLSHVIEHLHDPEGMLQACRKLLRPGGRLWIATPNIQGLGLRIYGEAWQPFETPRHLVMPEANVLKSMLERTGFGDVRFLRRGRGSRKRIAASNERARAMNNKIFPVAPLAALIDMAASIAPLGAEELVLVANKRV